jgi:hypothetical protein
VQRGRLLATGHFASLDAMGRGKHAEGMCLGMCLGGRRFRGSGGLCALDTVPLTPDTQIQMGKFGSDVDGFLSAESVSSLDMEKPRQFTPGPLAIVGASLFSSRERG